MDSGRHSKLNRLNRCSYLCGRGIYADLRVEVDLQDGDPVERLGFDAFHIVNDRHYKFAVDGDSFFNLFGWQSRVSPNDADYGNVNVREDVGGCCNNSSDA